MRIVGGLFRGLKLAEFSGEDVRPTSDRVKESLFNILGTRVKDARVLDLFCGSGSLGAECLSRGAAEVVFNDLSPASLAITKKNLSKLKNCGKIIISHADFKSCLKTLSGEFDLIFIDPPYASEAGVQSLEIIKSGDLLSVGGVIIFERDRAFSGNIKGLVVFDERKYGKTYLTFFKREQV